jgi:RNA polymerase sigma-70 factor (ECF subfamily)
MTPPIMQELLRHGDRVAPRYPATRGDDAALMAAFLQQHPDATRRLYNRVASRIYGLGFSLLHNATDAEDLVQDTFLKIWRTGSAFDAGRGSLDGWILLNARSIAIDRLRRRSIEARAMSLQPKPTEASDEAGPEERAEVRDLFRRATEAMDELPPVQRSALELVHLADRSTKEVAELQGIPRGTAKSRVHAAVVSLRKAFPSDDDAA